MSEAVDFDLTLASALSDAWQKDDFPLTQGQVGDLVEYLSLLNRWNRVHSLTAIQSGPEQVQLQHRRLRQSRHPREPCRLRLP